MDRLSCVNTCHDLTYSEVHAAIRNRKNWVSKEWSMMFL